MPKWVIILLVVLLVFGLGCCGFMTACHFMCQAVGTAASGAAQAAAGAAQAATAAAESAVRTQMEAQIAQQAALATQMAAQEAAAAGGAVPPPPLIVPEVTPTPGGRAGAAGAGAAGEAATVTTFGRMPSNFPNDIPQMAGLTPNVASADTARNSGLVQLMSTTKAEDIAAYYAREMQSRGWKSSGSFNAAGSFTTVYEKENRTATINVQPADANQSAVTIVYDQK
jgi:hypothetical protein